MVDGIKNQLPVCVWTRKCFNQAVPFKMNIYVSISVCVCVCVCVAMPFKMNIYVCVRMCMCLCVCVFPLLDLLPSFCTGNQLWDMKNMAFEVMLVGQCGFITWCVCCW